jgi:hypothetical protein
MSRARLETRTTKPLQILTYFPYHSPLCHLWVKQHRSTANMSAAVQTRHTKGLTQNMAVQWFEILLLTRKVPCSHSDPEVDPYRKKKKDKVIPATGRGGPLGCETSRIPHFLDNRQMAVRMSALCAGCPLTPGRFLVLISHRDWVHPRAIVRLEGLCHLKKSNALIGNRTHDLPACSIVPQPITLPRAPSS